MNWTGTKIKALRLSMNEKQKDFAPRIGLKPKYLSQVESNNLNVSMAVCMLLDQVSGAVKVNPSLDQYRAEKIFPALLYSVAVTHGNSRQERIVDEAMRTVERMRGT